MMLRYFRWSANGGMRAVATLHNWAQGDGPHNRRQLPSKRSAMALSFRGGGPSRRDTASGPRVCSSVRGAPPRGLPFVLHPPHVQPGALHREPGSGRRCGRNAANSTLTPFHSHPEASASSRSQQCRNATNSVSPADPAGHAAMLRLTGTRCPNRWTPCTPRTFPWV